MLDSQLQSLEHTDNPMSRTEDNERMSFTSVSSFESSAPSSITMHDDQCRVQPSIPQVAERHQTVTAPYDILGQFSFAPATQTTVVTTTTTTTTSFPPLIMKAPRHLSDLDQMLYPLAASPTPQAIKRLCMDVGGRHTVFREADDAAASLRMVNAYLLLQHISILRLIISFSINNSKKLCKIQMVYCAK